MPIDIDQAYYGVMPGRFDGRPGTIIAGHTAQILMDCAVRGEIERLDRLAARSAISDAWNETLKRRNWETYVRACRLIQYRPVPYGDDWATNADMFGKETR